MARTEGVVGQGGHSADSTLQAKSLHRVPALHIDIGMLRGMSVQIAVRLADDDLKRLDAAIARGIFPSRAAAVRAGLASLLAEEREAQIGEAYRRAYANDPQEGWIGEAGLRLGAALLAGPEPAADGDPDT